MGNSSHFPVKVGVSFLIYFQGVFFDDITCINNEKIYQKAEFWMLIYNFKKLTDPTYSRLKIILIKKKTSISAVFCKSVDIFKHFLK